MSRTVHYYNVYISNGDRKTNIAFTDLLDKVITTVNWVDRLREVNGHPMVLYRMKPPATLNRTVAIGKYRKDVKPYVGDMAIEKADLIKDDIIEMVTLVAIPNSKMAIIEFNMYGSKVKDISQYFNSFLPAGWKIDFEPIDSERSVRDIKDSHDIRKLDIKLDLHGGLMNRFASISTSNNSPQSLLGAIFSSAKVVNEQLNANVVSLSFGNGRKKQAIDSDQIINLIELLDLESDLIQSLKVWYKNARTGKVEELDLKYVGILKELIPSVNDETGWEALGDHIEANHFRKNQPGNMAYERKAYTFVDVALPQIITQPAHGFKVDVSAGVRPEEQMQLQLQETDK